MSNSPPTETYDDGAAYWEVDRFKITAEPARPGTAATHPTVTIDGRTTPPETALALADALRAAAMHALRGSLPT